MTLSRPASMRLLRCGVSGRVVPDGVVGPEANPLRDRAVLLLRAGKLLLGAEGLVGLRNISIRRFERQTAEHSESVPAS